MRCSPELGDGGSVEGTLEPQGCHTEFLVLNFLPETTSGWPAIATETTIEASTDQTAQSR